MEARVRKALLGVSELLILTHKRVTEADLRVRALQIVLAKATGVDLQSSEDSLLKIVETLRSKQADEAIKQVSAIVEILQRGKSPDKSDA